MRDRPHITETRQCRSCSAAMINGVLCHEHGCPDAWRDQLTPCAECGSLFYPSTDGPSLCSDDCSHDFYEL